MAKNNGQEVKLLTRQIGGNEYQNIKIGLERLNGISSVELGIYRGRISRTINYFLKDISQYSQSEEWKRIDKLISEINAKFAIVDEKGAPIISHNQYLFKTESIPLLNEDIEKLKEKERAAFDERERLVKEHEELLKMKVDNELTTIPLSLFKSIEDVYVKANKPAPFSTETIDMLMPIIDLER